MVRRQLGRSPLQVSPLCFGGNVFGWTADEAMSFRLLDAWVDAGMNFIDTADVYSRWVPGHQGGESETLIGKWLKRSGKRERVVLATKVGKDMGEGRVGLSARHIRAGVEASLQRLGTDVIDLYQSHDDDATTPLAQTLEAYADLIRQGKVRAIGASNHSAARLEEALAVSAAQGLPRYECLQPLWNLMDRAAYEAELEAVCVRHGLGVINFYALASGFLSGKYRPGTDLSARPRGARVRDYMNERGWRVLEALDRVAERFAATPAQVALAWQMARPSVTAPIVSATSLEQLSDLVRSTALTLDAAAMQQLEDASA